MKRSGFKRKLPVIKEVPDGALKKMLMQAAGLKQKKPMKPGKRKTTKARQSAKGEECTIRLPGVCTNDHETVVLCHSNELADGKGMGLKAPDSAAAYGCAACHDVIDGRAPRPDGMSHALMLHYFRCGIIFTQRLMDLKGIERA